MKGITVVNPYLKKPTTIAGQKNALRAELKMKRLALTGEERAIHAFYIANNLAGLPEFEQSGFIHIYCSFGAEVSTGEVIGRAFDANKRIVVPITPVPKLYKEQDDDSLSLLHTEIDPDQSFGFDRYGIPAPLPNEGESSLKYCHPAEILAPSDCIIVPLIAFDEQCQRLGYGGGYYDRFLSELPKGHGIRVGLAFECQKIDVVPLEAHDEPLDIIVTEKTIYHKQKP